MVLVKLWLIACVALAPLHAEAAYRLPPLPFEPNATEPVINGQTNIFHHDVHHAGYVKNLNAEVANYSDLNSLPLHELLGKVGTGQIPRQIESQVRNQGGGTWNHDSWWVTIAPPNSTGTGTSSISQSLDAAIKGSFNSTDAMIKQVQARGISHFGSGWSWLVALPNGSLAVTDTLNQDNPLMAIPGLSVRGVPILGIDVWEHSYYLKFGPNKTGFVNVFPTIVNWTRVSENYDNRLTPAKIIGEAYDIPS